MALLCCNQWFLINRFLFPKSARTFPAGRLSQKKVDPPACGERDAQLLCRDLVTHPRCRSDGQWEQSQQRTALELKSWGEHWRWAADDGLEKPVSTWWTPLAWPSLYAFLRLYTTMQKGSYFVWLQAFTYFRTQFSSSFLDFCHKTNKPVIKYLCLSTDYKSSLNYKFIRTYVVRSILTPWLFPPHPSHFPQEKIGNPSQHKA